MRGSFARIPIDAIVGERIDGVAEQPDRLQHAIGEHRLVDVELEMPLAAGDRRWWSGCRTRWQQTIVSASLCVGFVLPGMIEEPSSLLGQDQFAEARARAGAEQADIVCDLEQRGSGRIDGAVREHVGVVRGHAPRICSGALDERQLASVAAIRWRTAFANCGFALSPVPTAVPPCATG